MASSEADLSFFLVDGLEVLVEIEHKLCSLFQSEQSTPWELHSLHDVERNPDQQQLLPGSGKLTCGTNAVQLEGG